MAWKTLPAAVNVSAVAVSTLSITETLLAAVVTEFARFPLHTVRRTAVWATIMIAILVPVLSPVWAAIIAIEVAAVAAIVLAVIAVKTIAIVAIVTLRNIVVAIVVSVVVVALRAIVEALLIIERPLRHPATLAATFTTALGLTFAVRDLRLNIAAEILGLVIAEVFTVHRVLGIERLRPRQGTLVFAALAHLLFAIGQDDAVVVLGMLQIAFREHGIAGRQCVACQRNVFLGYMRRCSTNFDVGTRTLKTARQRILRFAVVAAATVTITIAIVVTAAAAAILLTLPHGLPFTFAWFLFALTRLVRRQVSL